MASKSISYIKSNSTIQTDNCNKIQPHYKLIRELQIRISLSCTLAAVLLFIYFCRYASAQYGNRDIILAHCDCVSLCVVRFFFPVFFLALFKLHTRISTISMQHLLRWATSWSTQDNAPFFRHSVQSRCRFKHDRSVPIVIAFCCRLKNKNVFIVWLECNAVSLLLPSFQWIFTYRCEFHARTRHLMESSTINEYRSAN